MSGHVDPRDVASVITDLKRRVENLERARNRPTESKYGPAVFNLTGNVTTSTSDPDVSAFPRLYTRLGLGLTTAGSSTTTVSVRVNGSSVVTADIGSGVTEKTVSVVVGVPAGQPLDVEVTVAGTGAEGLVVRLES